MSHVTYTTHRIMSHVTLMTHLNELSVILDRTSNNFDCRKFKQDFVGVPIALQQAVTGVPKIQTGFHRSNRESPSLKRVDWKTVQSGDPNIFSLISSESSWEPHEAKLSDIKWLLTHNCHCDHGVATISRLLNQLLADESTTYPLQHTATHCNTLQKPTCNQSRSSLMSYHLYSLSKDIMGFSSQFVAPNWLHLTFCQPILAR